MPNQDSPALHGHVGIIGIDVWEHAYYLKYQNKRPDYVSAWWDVVNWDEADRRYREANAQRRASPTRLRGALGARPSASLGAGEARGVSAYLGPPS